MKKRAGKIFLKRNTNDQLLYGKRLNITDHQRNSDEIYYKIFLDTY